MTLPSGIRLGPYEVVSLLGAGGMGEVYKARDTRLDRTVAIKILPAAISADPERRARFEREAKSIAGLAHPHICTLYDVGEDDGAMFLVMEHLEGETLAHRLEKGPLPIDQALTIGIEIADALSAAHRQGIIHRDLKPANVMLTKTGAKLLDFGLAKLAAHGDQPAVANLVSTPTRTAPLTGEGVIVGTLQYMAPEQVEGKPADARTDIWALGAILYEMLTGTRAFEATSAASLIGAILEREPAPLATLQPLTHTGLDRLVRQCLAKSPDDRPDTAHDLANELSRLRESSSAGIATVGRERRRRLLTPLGVARGVLLFLAGTGVMWLLRPSPPPMALTRLTLNVSPADELNAGSTNPMYSMPTPGGSCTAMVWTPDGQALVFVGRRDGVQQLYVRRLDAAEARPLAGTEGAQVPAVSADGEWVAFYAKGEIRKVPLAEGPVMSLASGLIFAPKGLTWDAHGRLFFGGSDGRIWAITPQGRFATVTTLREEIAHTMPWLLPSGRALLYTVRKREFSWGDEEVVAQTLETGERKVLLKDAADARYVSSGHLVFLRRGVLYGVPFDGERLEVLGKEVPVLGTIAQALVAGNSNDATGAGQFAVAASGTLAWISSPVAEYPAAALVSVDRRGQVLPLGAPLRSYGAGLRVSSDGRRLAFTLFDLTERGLWIYDLHRRTLTALVRNGEALIPTWSPDGHSLVFAWLTDGRRWVAEQSTDGTAQPRRIGPPLFYPSSFTPDGQQLAGVQFPVPARISVVTIKDWKANAPLVTTPVTQERWPAFSPDGRWLAYGSDVSGRYEVYVRPYPALGPAEPLSLDGADSPAWHPNGHELFFLSLPDSDGKRQMMAVDFAAGSPPRIGRPRLLFEYDPRELSLAACSPVRCYDVSRDGERFYAVQPRTPPRPPVVTHINLIQNWFEELKAKVPVK